jgi:hypothetical protein
LHVLVTAVGTTSAFFVALVDWSTGVQVKGHEAAGLLSSSAFSEVGKLLGEAHDRRSSVESFLIFPLAFIVKAALIDCSILETVAFLCVLASNFAAHVW